LESKKQLATLIVATETRRIEDGLRERESFERKFSQKNIRNEDCVELTEDAKATILDALLKSGQFKSKSELRRLFEQQGVRVVNEDGEVVLSPEIIVGQVHGVVRVGKRRFFQFVALKGD
jgi:tyrosyl-tRNA synthetase